jgi:hypothetical protein
VRILKLLLIFILTITTNVNSQEITSYLWNINSITSIGGNAVSLNGSPVVISDGNTQVVEFDGIDDGMIINTNPIQGANEFTVEVIIKPYTGGNYEQRFLSIRETATENIRLLMEIRVKNNGWWLDTFLKYNSASLTLLDTANKALKHTINEWTHAALVFKNDTMKAYVNGVEELKGYVDFNAMKEGLTSVGMRYNKASFYKGAIKIIKFTHKALSAKEFIKLNTDSDTITSVMIADKNKVKTIEIFPNPVVDKSIIKFNIPKSGNVTIKVSNLLGEDLAILSNGYYSEGSHIVVLDAAKFDNGIYFISIIYDKFLITKKIIIKRQ